MITIGRLLLIPPVLVLMEQSDPFQSFIAMLLFLLAALLDVVDGWLARRRGLVTFFGKFVDPLADKIMAMALLITMVSVGRLPAWIVILLIGREFYISGLRMLALGEGIEIVAGAGGKAKTAFQLIGICFLMVHYTYTMPDGSTMDFHAVGVVFIWVSLFMSLLSATTYTLSFIRALAADGDDS
jgi:CDP-diacylglycerol--glycerol-3-phosphate 3-phosphatidyltransferase